MAPIVIPDIKRQLSKTAPSKKASLFHEGLFGRDMFDVRRGDGA
jgi:hypothetical protein